MTLVNTDTTQPGSYDAALASKPQLRVLTFTTLYPNAAAPQHGVFVENRLRHLWGSGRVRGEVVAPVPWFPIDAALLGRYGRLARVPSREYRHGVVVHHPRYALLPKVSMTAAPFLLYAGAAPFVARLVHSGMAPDLIDAHYFYPDGIAAALLAKRLGLPFTITARGSDLNQIADFALPRRMILWAARQAAGLITVCEALRDRLGELGIEASRVTVLRNGVDLRLFRPHHRGQARATLGLQQPTLLSVGHLIERKGHDVVIRALPLLPDCRLLIVGEGPLRRSLQALAQRVGVADRVKFIGAVAHEALPEMYSAADALVLASSREGWANVLLEAMACGTPVVASTAWGNKEVVTSPAAGVLMRSSDPEGVADATRRLLASPPQRSATRRFAERFSWDATTTGQIELFEAVRRGRSRPVTRLIHAEPSPRRHTL
jgi:glycosyltransferase involved in cell wall biosynthesis